MGCRASKEDVAEPQSKSSHGRNKLHLKDKEAHVFALKPNEIVCALDGSECICSLYNHVISPAELNSTSSPHSVFIRTPEESLSSDEDEDEDQDQDQDQDAEDEEDAAASSIEISKKLSVVEESDNNSNASRTTALAALSGSGTENAVSDSKELDERVETLLAAAEDDGGELILPDQSEECCALGVLTQSAILQALMSTGPAVITQQFLGGDASSARVGHVAVISGPEPTCWETPLRKAEIIDLDEEQNHAGESLMLENTPELQENQSQQEPADAHALTTEEQYLKLRQQPAEDANSHKTVLNLEPRKGKLPPLSIVPPILVELPVDPFAKPEFPIVVKHLQTHMEAKVPPGIVAQFEDLSSSDRTPPLALELAASPNDSSNHEFEDKRSKSSLVTEHCEDGTPTPVTKSSVDSGWRSPPRDLPDLDIENIVLLSSESPEELDSGGHGQQQLPLISMLDCHGIHMDKKDLISPSLRLIS